MTDMQWVLAFQTAVMVIQAIQAVQAFNLYTMGKYVRAREIFIAKALEGLGDMQKQKVLPPSDGGSDKKQSTESERQPC